MTDRATLHTEIAEALLGVAEEARTYDPDDLDDGEGDVGIDVRVYVYDDGSWRMCTGLACYDTDHTGTCANGIVSPGDGEGECQILAREMVESVLEDVACR